MGCRPVDVVEAKSGADRVGVAATLGCWLCRRWGLSVPGALGIKLGFWLWDVCAPCRGSLVW